MNGKKWKEAFLKRRAVVVVVRVLAFSADDPSSNPSEVYNISVKILLIRMKLNKKRLGLAHL